MFFKLTLIISINMKHILLCLVIFKFAIFSTFANETLTGSGSANDPFLITSNEDFKTFINLVDNYKTYKKFFKLTTDITDYLRTPIGYDIPF